MNVGNEGLQSKVRIPPTRTTNIADFAEAGTTKVNAGVTKPVSHMVNAASVATPTGMPVPAPNRSPQGHTPVHAKSTNLVPNVVGKMPMNIPKPNSAPSISSVSNKKFTVKRNDPNDFGKKIVIYGPAGAGKSSLAAMAPGAVFLDLNKGLTGLSVQVVDGIYTFADLRAAVQQAIGLVPENGTLVIDTVSEADEFIVDYLKVQHNVASVAKLGYDKFPCAVEALRLLLSDFDPLIRSKRNVVLLAHEATINYKNAMGNDYRQMGPRLLHSANDSCRDAVVAWSDHTIRVALADAEVAVQTDAKGKVVAGKAINHSTERFISTDGNQSVIAKSRPILVAGEYCRLPSLIAFASPQDDAFWRGLADPRIFEQS